MVYYLIFYQACLLTVGIATFFCMKSKKIKYYRSHVQSPKPIKTFKTNY